MDVNTKIPILLQKLKTYKVQDTRFTKVKIWLMHLEQNLNGSYFSKDVVEKAIPTLANTPILGYIEADKTGEKDFSDHRQVLVKEEGQYKIKYIGSAYGVIPESNNAKFELRLCDDGIERQFLTCEGLIWNKWDEPEEILNRDEIKGQSMELHDDFSGLVADDGLFHFSEFKFFGACILGDEVQPAMMNSTVEKDFSLDKMREYIQGKMEQFKVFQHDNVDIKNTDEGGHIVNKKLEILKKYSLTENELEIDINEISIEELEVKAKELYALSNSQLASELSMALNPNPEKDDWGFTRYDYFYFDHEDSLVFAQSRNDNWRFVSFDFSMDGDYPKVNFDSKKICKFQIVPMEGSPADIDGDFAFVPKEIMEQEVEIKAKELEKAYSAEKEELTSKMQSEIDEATEKFSALEKEVNELKEFKTSKLTQERQDAENELFEKFASELSEDELVEIKETASEFSIQQLEDKLFALLGKKKAQFSANKKSKSTGVKITVDGGEDKQEKGKYSHLFEKYGK